MGGEEFALILPNTSLQGSFNLAEKIRQGVKTLAKPHGKSPHQVVTISLGVAAIIPLASLSPQVLIEQADQALYRAKAQGRDRACLIN